MQKVSLESRLPRALRILGALLVVLIVFSLPSYGQGNASLVGNVTDPTGAAVPDAKITITNVDTGLVRNTASNAAGAFTARELAIGRYNVRVEAPGFKAFERTGITLSVNDTVRADAALQVGETKDSVSVEANAIQVQSDTSEVSKTITATEVSELATNGRNVIQLATLVPGAASTIPDFDSPMAQNQNRTISFNGQRSDHNNWVINGGEAYDRGGGGILIVSPSQDALQEFKVLTSNYAADLGQSSGGMITMATKSGTKQYHASAWEYVRNDAFDANTYFANLYNRPKPQLRYNTFGFNAGGPIPIGREKKTFFFYNMEWRRLVQGGEINAVAIPNAMRTGDFSSVGAIRVPNTNDPAAIAKFTSLGLTPGQNFPGNQIPSSLFDPNAVALLKAGLFPGPNTSDGRFYAANPNRTNYREEAVRVDREITSKLTLMGSLIWDNGTQSQSTPLWAGSTYPTVGSTMSVPSWQGVVHATYTINPTLLNEASFNFNGNNLSIDPNGLYQRPSGINIPQFFSANTDNKLPTIGIGSPYSVNYDPGNWPWSNTWRSWQWKDDLSWAHGSHNLKFGASYMYTHKNQNIFGNTGGNFQFNSDATGNGFADFLLGYASSYSEPGVRDFVHISNNTYSLYAMDDWRVNKRLTLNLGLRWEGLPHAYDSEGRASNFYPNLYSASQAANFLVDQNYSLDPNGPGFTTVQGVALSNVKFYMNGVGIAGRNGIPKGLVKNHWDTFAPRVGFAFDLTGRQKTILRAGAGIFYERLGGNEQYNMGGNIPFSFNPNPSQVYLSNPAKNYVSGQASSTPIFPASMTTVAYDYEIPTALQWNFGIQHQLRDNTVVSMTYVGNSNYHQSQGRNINTLMKDDPNRLGVCGGTCGYTGTQLNANFYRPYRGWAGIAPLEMTGNSNYNSLQISLRTSAWKNLTLSSSYTWSHAMDIIDGELFANISNPFDARYDRASAGFDRRHMLITSFVYQFPFFKKASGIPRAILGGWELSGIATMESGNPLSVSGGADNLGYGGGTSNRANVVAPIAYPKTRQMWFMTNVFTKPAPLQWGTSGRNIIIGPGRNNWNVAMYKAFQFTERARFEFRAETFNTFNHTQFTNPNVDVSSGSFGTISGTYAPRIFQLGAKMMF